MLRWDFGHVQDNVNLHILGMLKGTFSRPIWNMRKGNFKAYANSKDPDQPVKQHNFLRGRIHFQGGVNQNCFASLLKRVYSKKKEFAPLGSNFPFRVDHFKKWLGVQEGNQEVTKVVLLVENGKKSTKCNYST